MAGEQGGGDRRLRKKLSMMTNSFVIETTGTEFLIKKTRQAIIKETLLFTIFFLVVVALIAFFYLYITIRINPLHILYFGMLLLFIYNLYYQNKIKGTATRIVKTGDEYRIRDQFVFGAAEGKGLVLYGPAGEIFSDFSGDLYLKVKANEYPLYSGVTEEELLEIRTKLEIYFAEQLAVEWKRALV